jgi:hypothetical protein
MKNMPWPVWIVFGLAILCPRLPGEETPDPGPGRERALAKALATEVAGLDGQEHTLKELLQLFGKMTQENFILDPGLPKEVGEKKITVQAKKGGTVLDALSIALTLTQLRYTLLGGAIFISTEGRLANRLLNDAPASSSMDPSGVRSPMGVGEASAKFRPFDPYQEDFLTARDFISHAPWRHWAPPEVNPKTGLTDFPGPPIWMEDPDIGHPRFRYTSTLFFLKPEYQELEREKREYRETMEAQRKEERQGDTRALAALLQWLKDHPDLTAKQVLEKLGAEADK